MTLDVGGSRFRTQPVTVQRTQSMLSVLINGPFAREVQADGSWFIDRDRGPFGHVLDYQRLPARATLPAVYHATPAEVHAPRAGFLLPAVAGRPAPGFAACLRRPPRTGAATGCRWKPGTTARCSAYRGTGRGSGTSTPRTGRSSWCTSLGGGSRGSARSASGSCRTRWVPRCSRSPTTKFTFSLCCVTGCCTSRATSCGRVAKTCVAGGRRGPRRPPTRVSRGRLSASGWTWTAAGFPGR